MLLAKYVLSLITGMIVAVLIITSRFVFKLSLASKVIPVFIACIHPLFYFYKQFHPLTNLALVAEW